MKKTVSIFFILSTWIFAFLIIGCVYNNTEAQQPKNEILPYSIDSWNVLYNYRSSFNKESNVLEMKKGYGNVGFGFKDYKSVDASGYDYACLTYSELSVPQVEFRISYEDKSRSEVFLQANKNKVYIKLDPERKDKILEIFLMATIGEDYYKDSISVKLEKFEFLNSIPAIKNKPIIDVIDGKFDDSLTGEKLCENMAIGWNISRLATCPHYNNKDAEFMRFGFQNDYVSKKDSNGKTIINKDGEPEFETKRLGTGAEGMELEYKGRPPENKDRIKAGYEHGFKSLRVNVTWFAHIIDENYTIDSEWMNRVKQIVDWAIADGYYVILNDHHSVYKYMHSPIPYATGYNLKEEDKAESENYLKGIWTQIATAFNGSYDEHLIFETLNEPRISDSNKEGGEYWPMELSEDEKSKATAILNEYNQLIVDTIRRAGGNNLKRFVMVPTYATGRELAFDYGFKIPEDTANKKMIVAAHWYPLMKEVGILDYTDELRKEFDKVLGRYYSTYVKNDVPVCMTEFNIASLGEYNELFPIEKRFKCLKDFCEIAGKNHISMSVWDDGYTYTAVNMSYPYDLADGDGFFPVLINTWKESYAESLQNPNADSIEIDLSKFNKYDKSTGIISIPANWIWADYYNIFDASSYDCIQLEYEQGTEEFLFGVAYSDDSRTEKLCQESSGRILLELDETKKSSIRQIYFSSKANAVSLKPKCLTLLKN